MQNHSLRRRRETKSSRFRLWRSITAPSAQGRMVATPCAIQDLAAISAPYPMIMPPVAGEQLVGHQRSIDPNHAADIKRYLEHGKPRYIPEIILSVHADFRDELDAQAKAIGIISDTVAGLTVRRRWKSRNIAIHQLTVERRLLPTLVQTELRIRRIDGNHRLHLADQLHAAPHPYTKYLAPFCLILLGPPGDANDDFVESMLFHTINSTGVQLGSEHALQLVLGQAAQYRPTAEEEFQTDAPLHLTRLLKERMDVMRAPQRARLGETPATVLNAAAVALVSRNAALSQHRQTMGRFADDLCAAITDILAIMPVTHPDLCKADFFVELASLAWAETDPTGGHDIKLGQAAATLQSMGRWLGRDGLHSMQSKGSLAEQLFEIFRSVRSRVPKRVFLSRWYPADADGNEKTKADLRKRGIDQTLAELRTEGVDLA